MEMLSMLLALCEGNPGGFPSQRASNLGFDVFFDVSLNNDWTNIWVVGDATMLMWCNTNGSRYGMCLMCYEPDLHFTCVAPVVQGPHLLAEINWD